MPQSIPPDDISFEVDRTLTGLGNPDFTIPDDDCLSFSISQRAGRATDQGELVVANNGGKYSSGSQMIEIGDKIIGHQSLNTEFGFGEGGFGEGPFGGQARFGTWQVLDWGIVPHGPTASDRVLEIADWVFSIMSQRLITIGRSETPISGSRDAVLNTVLRRACPEIDRTALPEIDVVIDYYAENQPVRKVVDELAVIASRRIGPVLQASESERLIFRPLEHEPPTFDDPLPREEFGEIPIASESQSLINNLHVSGGTDTTDNIGDSQETVTRHQTVADGTRLVAPIYVPKSEVPQVELRTYSETGGTISSSGIRPRIQAAHPDDASVPIAPDDEDLDLTTGPNKKTDLNPDGWTTWDLGNHDIPERNAFLIVDSGAGEDGDPATSHRVGVDGSNTPAHRVHFSKPIEAVVPRPKSIERYGKRDEHMSRESIVSVPAVRGLAATYLDRRAQPDITLGPTEALSTRTHNLHVGDVLPFEFPEYEIDSDFVVTRREDTYEGPTLTTSLEFADITRYA